MARKKRSGLTCLDPQKLEQARLRVGLSKTDIADKSGLARNAVLKAFRGEGVFAKTVKRIAAELKFADPNDMLPEPVQANGHDRQRGMGSGGIPGPMADSVQFTAISTLPDAPSICARSLGARQMLRSIESLPARIRTGADSPSSAFGGL
jgi:transcriptional regulator with XRE-family HTH domain